MSLSAACSDQAWKVCLLYNKKILYLDDNFARHIRYGRDRVMAQLMSINFIERGAKSYSSYQSLITYLLDTWLAQRDSSDLCGCSNASMFFQLPQFQCLGWESTLFCNQVQVCPEICSWDLTDFGLYFRIALGCTSAGVLVRWNCVRSQNTKPHNNSKSLSLPEMSCSVKILTIFYNK